MTCQELSDKMPAVARGAAEWSPAEAAHLVACAECRREWVVVGAGRLVARDLTVNADALAAVVLRRLRTEPEARLLPRSRWLIGLAAAAVLAVILVPGNAPAPLPVESAAAPLEVDVSGLTALSSAGLTDVLESFDTMWTETSTTDAPSLDDLDPQELERVQGSWEI